MGAAGVMDLQESDTVHSPAAGPSLGALSPLCVTPRSGFGLLLGRDSVLGLVCFCSMSKGDRVVL